MRIGILLLGSFGAAVVSGAAGFGGSLLLLPVGLSMHFTGGKKTGKK